MTDSINKLFSLFLDDMKVEQDLREEIKLIVRDIEQATREALSVLQLVHQEDGIKQIPELCDRAEEQIKEISGNFKQLELKISVQLYYKYYDHWRFVTQKSCFLIAFVHYLRHDTLITLDKVAEQLDLKTDKSKGFHLDLEDYLMGLLYLASELSRFAVNSVTNGDYNRPIKISKFVMQLNSGFRLLNLKNDSLRKKFDALKYDIKKIEEVVYDLSIRGLRTEST